MKMKGSLLFSLIPSLAIAWVPIKNVESYTTRRYRASSSTTSELKMSIPNSFDTLTSGLASIARLSFGIEITPSTTGINVESSGVRVKALYDVESSRECRMVRERITELDLIVERVIPAASNSRAMMDLSSELSVVGGEDVMKPGSPFMVVSESTVEGDLVEKKIGRRWRYF